jgi:hypothetical protein
VHVLRVAAHVWPHAWLYGWMPDVLPDLRHDVMIVWLPSSNSLFSPAPGSLLFYCSSHLHKSYGLRRSTIIRSLGRFLRVFAPSVGKPQGVCGWLPFTRPSPPPCG